MGWNRFSTEVDEKDFELVWRTLAELLEVSSDSLEPGVLETARPDGWVTTALDPGQQFIAARWYAEGCCQELFCVKPASKPLQLGYAVVGVPSSSHIPVALQRWLDADRHRVPRLPSFTTLSLALASQGVSIKEVPLEEAQFKAERDYLKQLLAEQRELLRQSQARLRMGAPLVGEPCIGAGIAEASKPDSASFEWSLDTLAEWCAEHDEEVVVLPRARNGAKKSRYEDPALMLVALELLAGPYRDCRMGLIGQADFDKALAETGLKLAGSVGPSVAGEHGDAYFVSWAGRRRFLELHLTKGGGHDQRYCFRLYFFWCEESERAVIGSMPFHLSNSLS